MGTFHSQWDGGVASSFGGGVKYWFVHTLFGIQMTEISKNEIKTLKGLANDTIDCSVPPPEMELHWARCYSDEKLLDFVKINKVSECTASFILRERQAKREQDRVTNPLVD